MRIVRKEKLERMLGTVPMQSISLFGYSLVYGQANMDLRVAEDREITRKAYLDYFDLCRHGAVCHPSPYAEFARLP